MAVENSKMRQNEFGLAEKFCGRDSASKAAVEERRFGPHGVRAAVKENDHGP